MKKQFLTLLLSSILALTFCGTASPAYDPGKPVCTVLEDQIDPAIYKNYIV